MSGRWTGRPLLLSVPKFILISSCVAWTLDFSLEPDLHPLYRLQLTYPSYYHRFGFGSFPKSELVSHSLSRACIFGDLSFYSISCLTIKRNLTSTSAHARKTGLVDQSCILGFGSESERDVEREECIRLLIAQGADPTSADKASISF